VTRLTDLARLWTGVFGLLRRSAPRITALVAMATVAEIAASVGLLYAAKLLVDAISVELSASAAGAADHAMSALVIMGIAVVANVLLHNLGNALRMRQRMAVGEYVDEQIHDRAISVDLQFYETPQYYDALERARQGGTQRPAQIVGNVMSAFKSAGMLLAVLVMLAAIDLRLMPVLLLPIIIGLLVRLHFTRKLFDWRMARAQIDRRAGYLDWMLTSITYAKELRLNRSGNLFRDQYRSLRAQMNKGEIDNETARLWPEFAVSLFGAAVFLGASAWLLQEALSQQRLIGDVALFVLLLRRAEAGGQEFVGSIARVVDDQLYLRRLFDFLSIKPRIERPLSPAAISSPLNQGVKLSNVGFRYEGSAEDALQDVSLELPPGRIVALVGENGSGKTTLIKLLTRLYDPTSGTVSLEGRDVRDLDPAAYRRLFSVIFQDYAVYAETAAENIRLGDPDKDAHPDSIARAAQQAGASEFIERLPLSYATPLTKLFDNGRDLSVGQYQRLALARALYADSSFLILDEPTSAVDPRAEHELFEKFRERIGGRGALIISHRLSTVRMADYTYVLQGGRIIEHGVHDALVAQGGYYADLFEKQGQHYRT
jgi:ATP-binding cassette, subfamily B, bacterial